MSRGRPTSNSSYQVNTKRDRRSGGLHPAPEYRSNTGLHPASPARIRSRGSGLWATAARIAKLPDPVADCSVDAVDGQSEDEVDLMAPISRRRRTKFRRCFRLASLALLLTLAPAAWADDFRDLFDGKSLDGWVV